MFSVMSLQGQLEASHLLTSFQSLLLSFSSRTFYILSLFIYLHWTYFLKNFFLSKLNCYHFNFDFSCQGIIQMVYWVLFSSCLGQLQQSDQPIECLSFLLNLGPIKWDNVKGCLKNKASSQDFSVNKSGSSHLNRVCSVEEFSRKHTLALGHQTIFNTLITNS